MLTRRRPRDFSSAADQVLENLFAAYGNRRQPRPRLEVVQDNLGPRYRESARTIVLDRRSLQVCRTFGSDSLSALAFIIGHELAHFFQEEVGGRNGEFSYLAYDKNQRSNPEKERLADIQGLFNAYLAGYRSTAILPELIARLYDAYQLPGHLKGYLTLEERQQSALPPSWLLSTPCPNSTKFPMPWRLLAITSWRPPATVTSCNTTPEGRFTATWVPMPPCMPCFVHEKARTPTCIPWRSTRTAA
ncbi:MAG: hypothetical protein J5I98_30325 [Phaeodactylibacter sp.]|nr:hypothetical protein [Phaeodactylibacter sp.]